MGSGKFVLRLKPETHRALKEEARRRGISLNQLCVEKIESRPKSAAVSGEWVERILAVYEGRVLAILLYGSRARQQGTTASDTDLMIVLPEGVSPMRADYALWDEKLQTKFGSQVNPSFVAFKPNQTPSGLWLEVALDGIVLWQRDSALQGHLAKLRAMIANGDYRRKLVHGQPQWIHQEESK